MKDNTIYGRLWKRSKRDAMVAQGMCSGKGSGEEERERGLEVERLVRLMLP